MPLYNEPVLIAAPLMHSAAALEALRSLPKHEPLIIPQAVRDEETFNDFMGAFSPRQQVHGALAAAAALGWDMPALKRRQPKPLHKCDLPGCDIMTARDYCCAEHCHQHKELRCERNKLARRTV